MDKVYNHKDVEERIYKHWEKSGYFKPDINPKGKPYCIILPPPNANGALHFGHAMFTVEDILIRYHRMKGEAALWFPGTDHAGIETQFVFEKILKGQGKSRFDFNRETLCKMIDEYVNTHRGGIENQLRSLGFSLDWSREKYTLDPDIVKLVYKTFKKMYDEGLVYRDYRLVNYCTFDGTSFSDLEVVHEQSLSPLYYIKYGPLVLATTRPETKFGDTGIAVHPKDKRYKKYIGRQIEIETVLGKAKIKVVADESVDPKFGTGVVKITPAHDFNDFEVGKRHNFPLKQVIGFDGKMNDKAGKFAGLYVKQARKMVVEEMQKKGLIEKIDENYKNRLGLCYKCKNVLEPLPLEQWFVKVESLRKQAIAAVKDGKIKITPKNFENIYFQWMENLRDWNISRQIVWGIRIPAWYKKFKQWDLKIYDGEKIFESLRTGKKRFETRAGKPKGAENDWREFKIGDIVNFSLVEEGTEQLLSDQKITKKIIAIYHFPSVEVLVKKLDVKEVHPYRPEDYETWWKKRPKFEERIKNFGIWAFELGEAEAHSEIKISEKSPGEDWEQDEDTFDTWFSSGQWPYLTLKTGKPGDLEKFYPTSVMETGYDLLKAWVSRMIMLGLYVTGEVPFKNVLFHGLVNDPYGKKMSKSKGNVINPLELVDQYGADAVRFALIYGNATGNDQALSYPKLDAARKFTNKIWNMARFIQMKRVSSIKYQVLSMEQINETARNENDKRMVKKVRDLIKKITKNLDNYNFNYAAEGLYDFIWHDFADNYIEDIKNRINADSYLILTTLYIILLKMLHPFMPFVTEEIYQRLKFGKFIMIDKWPSYA